MAKISGAPTYGFIGDMYESGYREGAVTLKDGNKTMRIRLFTNNTGQLCYYKKGSWRVGYRIERLFPVVDKVTFSTSKLTTEKTPEETHLSNLAKFKKLFMEKAHPNLWEDRRKAYELFDLSAYRDFLKKTKTISTDMNLFSALVDFVKDTPMQKIIVENRYKLTTVKSHAPKYRVDHYAPKYRVGPYGHEQYRNFIANIKRHLDNKENFRYFWRSDYDVNVAGSLCKDGVYRATFSLERKGIGNGHYYILVNENQAVFAEDD